MESGRFRRSQWLLALTMAAGCTALREGPLTTSVDGGDAASIDVAESVDASSPVDALSPADTPPLAADRVTVGDALDAAISCPEDMVLIPGGTFQMGAAGAGTMPVHAVRLSAYCLDRTEVTVEAYRSCVTCSAAGIGADCNANIASRGQHPINCVRWLDAQGYCDQRGRRLPTEAQWEYAARGAEGRTYPWGDEGPTTRSCWDLSSTCPIGAFPSGATPLGVVDLAGNVAEWVSDLHEISYTTNGSVQVNPTGPSDGAENVTRGGSWQPRLFASALVGYARSHAPPRTLSPFIGFRCALPATP